MRFPRLVTNLLLVVLAVFGTLWFFPSLTPTLKGPQPKPAHLAHLHGPVQPSMVAPITATLPSQYEQGGPSRLAILLTDPHANWLGLAHGLKSIGVPFVITDDYREAMRHRVVMLYPTISGKLLSAEAIQAVMAHPRHGGTLIGSEMYGVGFPQLFGFREMQPSATHTRLHLTPTLPLTAPFTDPKELTLRLAPEDPKRAAPIGTYTYTDPVEPPIATYNDGTAAIISHHIGTGQTYAFGVDLGFLLLKGHTLREEGLAEQYDNGFEPMLDVFLRLLQGIYLAGEPDAVVIQSVPYHRALSVLITHDIDAQTSMHNALHYAELERAQGIIGTYFVQAKYLRDFNDEVLLTPQAVRDMQQLASMGMELGSHTVAHSKVFHDFPMGTGTEQFPNYSPFVHSRFRATDASILGELRVSKFLIESLTGGRSLVSFRPGELSNPLQLPQALAATGYRFSSSATANNSLTHLPYQLTMSRDTKTEAPIFEFPVTIEDEALPDMGDRVQEGIALAQKIARYGGLVTILIHPNIVGHKYAFEQQFIDAVKPQAWFASVGQFGTWWAARNAVALDVTHDHTLRHLTIQAPETVQGLTLQIPSTWTLLDTPDTGRVGDSGPGYLVLREVTGSITLSFEAEHP